MAAEPPVAQQDRQGAGNLPLTRVGECGRVRLMTTERKQLSTWATKEEAAAIQKAAKAEHRSVSQLLLVAALFWIRQQEAA